MKRLITLISFLMLTQMMFSQTTPQSNAFGDNWVVTDGFGRTLPTYEETGTTKNDRYVGMYYNLTHGYYGLRSSEYEYSHSVMEVLEKDHINLEWNQLDPEPAVFGYFCAEPEDGYMHSSDSWYERKQLIMLANAGVDFIFVDQTNVIVSWHSVEVTMREICDLQKMGYNPPKLVLWTQDHINEWTGAEQDDRQQIRDIYNNIYKAGKYKDAWFMYEGKPLLMSPQVVFERQDPIPSADQEILDYFTWRYMWADKDANGTWNFMSGYPQKPGKDDAGNIEQLVVMKAYGGAFRTKDQCSVPPIGSSGRMADNYMPPLNELWYNDSLTGQGEFLKEQFKRLGELSEAPRFLTFSQWNEYGAGAWRVNEGQAQTFCFYGRELDPSKDRWMIDAFNIEYNRDMGPLKDYFTDSYYYQMMNYIRQYKGQQPPQPVSASKTISIDNAFEEWTSVTPVFKDPVGDTKHRCFIDERHQSFNTNYTGRNDIIETRTTYDLNHVYFYVKTQENLTNWQDTNWMVLYIDADLTYETGWEGFDYVVNLGVINNKNTSVKQYQSGEWKYAGSASYHTYGNQLEIAVPKSLIGLSGDSLQFYYKWIDNQQVLNDIQDVLANGDAAPDRRFKYYFNGKQDNSNSQKNYVALSIPGTIEAEDFDNGGEMVAYHDIDASNSGAQYRTTEGVDIEVCSAGGYNITDISDAEWLEYSVMIKEAGTYQVSFSVASVNGNDKFHLQFNGSNHSGNMIIPATGGAQNWQDISTSMELPEGHYVFRLFLEDFNGGKIDKISFEKTSGLAYGNGDGLSGTYYTGVDFEDSITTKIDPVVFLNTQDFYYAPGQSSNRLSIRWKGQVQALSTETYTFLAEYNDRCRLWINGRKLIDNWNAGGLKKDSGTVSLEAGKKYDIVVEFGKTIGSKSFRLDWKTATINRQLVPQTQLYSISQENLGTPANLNAWMNNTTDVKLVWEDNSAAESFFLIERKLSGGSFAVIDTVDFNISSYIDTGLANPENYVWRVVASNVTLSGDYSNEARLCAMHAITFDSIQDVLSTSLPFKVQAISEYGLPTTLSLCNGPATLLNDTVTLTDFRGIVTLKAIHTGNDSLCASEVYTSFNIIHDCSPQTITFDSIPDQTADSTLTIQLRAISDKGLPVSFSIISGPAVMSNDSVLRLTGTQGAVVVKANQTGSYDYCEANTVLRSFFVSLPECLCDTMEGFAIVEKWYETEGTNVQDIPFATRPDAISSVPLMEFEGVFLDREWYSIMVSAFICAPYDGNYTFYIAGDDAAELRLSTGENRDSLSVIAHNNGYTGFREWDKYVEQKSAPITLTGGNKYYMEAVVQEAVGAEHVSVRWITPFGRDEIIPADFISPGCESQTITFPYIYDVVDSNKYVLKAYTSSGLSVSYKVVAGDAIMDGDTLIFNINRGRVTVTASADGDDRYCAATGITNRFMVTTSVNENYLNEKIGVYPNPASNEIIIEINNASNNFEVNEIVMTDLAGRVVLTDKTTFNHSKAINISQLKAGMYFLKMETPVGILKMKLIKQ